ncbi:MAG: type II toxin-antitoxin system RelE family toxin [Promethearchaeota archaeon]
MKFKISWSEKAIKQLEKLPRLIAKQIYHRVDELGEEPRPAGVKKLVGFPYYRIRVGDYRVIFDIQDDKLIVLILEIGHRKKIYK